MIEENEQFNDMKQVVRKSDMQKKETSSSSTSSQGELEEPGMKRTKPSLYKLGS